MKMELLYMQFFPFVTQISYLIPPSPLCGYEIPGNSEFQRTRGWFSDVRRHLSTDDACVTVTLLVQLDDGLMKKNLNFPTS
jgi:hypothetical protein